MSINSFKLVSPPESARTEAHSSGAILSPESCQKPLLCAHRSRPENIVSLQIRFEAALTSTMSPDRSTTDTPTGSVARTRRRSGWSLKTASLGGSDALNGVLLPNDERMPAAQARALPHPRPAPDRSTVQIARATSRARVAFLRA